MDKSKTEELRVSSQLFSLDKLLASGQSAWRHSFQGELITSSFERRPSYDGGHPGFEHSKFRIETVLPSARRIPSTAEHTVYWSPRPVEEEKKESKMCN